MQNKAKMRGYPDGLQAFLTQLCAKITIFGQIIPITNPLGLFIDFKGEIHAVFVLILVEIDVCAVFYKKLQRLFHCIYI